MSYRKDTCRIQREGESKCRYCGKPGAHHMRTIIYIGRNPNTMNKDSCKDTGYYCDKDCSGKNQMAHEG